jgi:hypothetical protein
MKQSDFVSRFRSLRHSREGGNPVQCGSNWVPAPHLRGGRLCAGMTYLCRYATKVIRRVRLDAPFSQVVRQDAPYKSYSLRFSDRPKLRNELCFFGDDFAGLSGFGSASAKPTC